jgi:bifunctional UDP-N-acetylglucosamine pyrophosphorylase/glucosamine-1-phosphate N-acetyltransferase
MDDDLRSITAIILAAGQGTRMKSSLPKVLHQVAGKPLVIHAIENTQSVITEKPVVVIGHGADQVRTVVGDRARFAIQHPQLGTAHAVQAAKEALAGFHGLILVFYADMPLFTKETMQRLVNTQSSNPGVMTMLSVFMDDPHGFGRVVRNTDGSVQAIVEEAQADVEIRKIHELNVGAYCFRSEWLWTALDRIRVSPKGEYYLTDTVELAVRENQRVECVVLDDPREAIGINTRVHLAEAEAILRQRINQRWMLSGVTMIDPETTYIDQDVILDPETIIYPNTHLYGNTHIGTGCKIGPSVYLWNTVIENNCTLGPEVAIRNTTVKANQTIQFAMMDEDQNILDIE